MPNRKGSILIITLWILAILVVFSLGLARRAALNLRIASYQRDKIQAGYLARAGVNQAIQLLKKEVSAYDTKESCGIALGTRQAQDVFSKKWGEGANDGFKIGFITPSGDFAYGFQDEESRINLNGLGQSGLGPLNKLALLKELFGAKDINGYEPLAAAVAEWTSTGTGTTDGNLIKKGTDFCRPEELLAALENFYAVSGQKESDKFARQVYNDLKDVVTVFAEKLNVNTASEETLRIITRTVAISVGKDEGFADKVTQEIITYHGSNPVITKIDDISGSWNDLAEKEFFAISLKQHLAVKSDYFRFTVIGQYRGASKEISVVYHRPNSKGEIVYWHER